MGKKEIKKMKIAAPRPKVTYNKRPVMGMEGSFEKNLLKANLPIVIHKVK